MNLFEPRTTALVAVDLQKGIVALSTEPSTSREVVERTAGLAKALRRAGGTVVYVTVSNSDDGGDVLSPALDNPPAGAKRPFDYAELDAELPIDGTEIRVTKRQWGAFYGTDLDLQLRRRGIKTIILTGIATHIGVESTARDAFEHGYDQIFVSDAIASPSIEAHEATFKAIFPRIGMIRDSQKVIELIG